MKTHSAWFFWRCNDMKGCARACFIHTAAPRAVRRKPGNDPGLSSPPAYPTPMDETRSIPHPARRGCARMALRIAAVAVLLALSSPAHAHPWGRHGGPGGLHPAMGAHGPRMGGGFQHHENFPRGPQRGPYMRPQMNPAHEHLPEWYRTHQNMSFQQQERALRQQPGFNRLSPAQRQRVLNRLRYLDSQPPAVRQRMMAWQEAFERLSPERRQEVRAAAQAFQRMPPARKRQLRSAFHTLRALPPNERTTILNSARFRAEYSPRERHILGSLLSVQPWQAPQPPPPPQPPRH